MPFMNEFRNIVTLKQGNKGLYFTNILRSAQPKFRNKCNKDRNVHSSSST